MLSGRGAVALVAIALFRLAAVAAGQRPYDYGFDTSRAVRRQVQVPFVVTGLGGRANGSLPERPEIRALQQDEDKWTLYLLGLSMMQYTEQSQPLSWYQIAGIHGVPWQPWGGVQPIKGSEQTGYCTHNSILFLTWHRPYLALYEQVLYNLIQYIASLYPDDGAQARYKAAAADFRIPYMDWAARPPAGESVLPPSVGSYPAINVSGPNGVQEISNPLYTYLFKPLNASIFIEPPYDLWLTTVRSPTANDSTAQSNNTRVAMALDQNFQSFQQRTYNLFSNYKNYSAFSNEGWIPPGKENEYDSLESLHDTIHTLAGLQGHMTWIPFSAFDPIFFLHHCMVDRIFAMWQVLNPDTWVVPTPAPMASYTTAKGQIQDSATALTPFLADSDGAFWTSDAVRDPSVFGYTYAELVGFSVTGSRANAAARSQVMAAVNRLYGSSSPASLVLRAPGPRQATTPGVAARYRHAVDATGTGVSRTDGRTGRPPPGTVVVGNTYREWVANVHVEKQALDSSFFVHIFLGEPSACSRGWPYAPNLVGTMSVFASPGGGAMGGMRHQQQGGRRLTSGTVPLTAALVSKVAAGRLAGLETGAVQPFLERELRFRVLRSDGTAVDPTRVPGLGIRIVSSAVQAPASERELPRWGKAVNHFSLI